MTQVDPLKVSCHALNRLRDACYACSKDHGFHDRDNFDLWFANQCNNLTAEISELWDAWRTHKSTEYCDKADKMRAQGLTPLTCQSEELADIIIRVCDMAGRMNIDLEMAVYNKFQYNLTRPYKHGKRN